MNAIAVLTVTPSDHLLEFYSGFVRLGYRVFVVIDDNNFKLGNAEVKAKNAGVSLMQFEEYECRRAGFFDLNPLPGEELDVAKMPGHWLLARLGGKSSDVEFRRRLRKPRICSAEPLNFGRDGSASPDMPAAGEKWCNVPPSP